MLKKAERTIIFGERVPKTTEYPDGWKKIFEEKEF